MADVILHGFPQSTYVRTARLALEEKGVSYEIAPVDLGSDELKKVHPHSHMPALTHGDFHLYETSAICRYIDEAFEGPALVPTDLKERAIMDQWISALNHYYDTDMIRCVVLERMAERFGRVTDEERIKECLPKVEHELEVLEARLAEADYLAGSNVSIADFFLLPILFYLWMTPEGQPMIQPKENIMAWWARMESRPSFAATQPPMPEAAE